VGAQIRGDCGQSGGGPAIEVHTRTRHEREEEEDTPYAAPSICAEEALITSAKRRPASCTNENAARRRRSSETCADLDPGVRLALFGTTGAYIAPS
jgi:hypothetical protein